MIKKTISLNNNYLLSEYNKMINSMFEYIYDGNKGIRGRIKAKKISLIDYRTFSFFGMYNDEIYKLYKNISMLIKDACQQNNINFERSSYYLFGDMLDSNIKPGVSLKLSPDSKMCFAGLYVINANTNISINGNSMDISNGDMILFDDNDKVVFSSISKDDSILYFRASPLQYLHRQYYQKWIPII